MGSFKNGVLPDRSERPMCFLCYTCSTYKSICFKISIICPEYCSIYYYFQMPFQLKWSLCNQKATFGWCTNQILCPTAYNMRYVTMWHEIQVDCYHGYLLRSISWTPLLWTYNGRTTRWSSGYRRWKVALWTVAPTRTSTSPMSADDWWHRGCSVISVRCSTSTTRMTVPDRPCQTAPLPPCTTATGVRNDPTVTPVKVSSLAWESVS